MRQAGNLPGFNALSGNFEASERAGTVALTGSMTRIEYPGVFVERGISLDTLGARIGWLFPHGELELRLDDVTFSNADLAGTASGVYRAGKTGAGGIDIAARFNRAEGRHVYKYIPNLGSVAAEWLKRAIVAGNVGETRLRLRGDLNRFPGDARLRARLAEVYGRYGRPRVRRP
jgi:uncharacterized protein YhdP